MFRRLHTRRSSRTTAPTSPGSSQRVEVAAVAEVAPSSADSRTTLPMSRSTSLVPSSCCSSRSPHGGHPHRCSSCSSSTAGRTARRCRGAGRRQTARAAAAPLPWPPSRPRASTRRVGTISGNGVPRTASAARRTNGAPAARPPCAVHERSLCCQWACQCTCRGRRVGLQGPSPTAQDSRGKMPMKNGNP